MSVEAEISALRSDFQTHLEHDAAIQAQTAVTAENVKEIKAHVKTQNGQVAEVMAAQLRQEGAFGMLKWVIGVVFLPLLGIGVTLGGLALGYIIKGGI